MPAIAIKNLKKNFKNTQALNGVSLDIQKGDFFGYLGPNGAGKTTTINILTGLVKKTSGSVYVHGYDLDSQETQIKHLFGIVPQEENLDPFLNCLQTIAIQAGFYGISYSQGLKRSEQFLKTFGLWDKKDVNFRKLSGGMKKRLLLARALVHNPPILLLDEPTAGIDVELRVWLWEYLQKLNKEGKTIILTTHYLEEAEKLCNKIAIISHGKIVINDSTKNLLHMKKKSLHNLYMEATQ